MKTLERILQKPSRNILLPLFVALGLLGGGAATGNAAVIVRAKVGPAKVVIAPRPAKCRVVVVKPARPAQGRYVWVPGHWKRVG